MSNQNLPQRPNSIKICSVEGCDLKHLNHSYCSKHWARVRKYGSPDIVRKINTGTLEERFWQLVKKDEPHKCWKWQGTLTVYGYGKLMYQYKQYAAHRLSYFLANGEWPKVTMHSCDNKRCVNPGHLRNGTVQENVNEAHERGLAPIGSRIGTSKLSEDQVRSIKQMFRDGFNNSEIARMSGVTPECIWLIRHGRNWKHI